MTDLSGISEADLYKAAGIAPPNAPSPLANAPATDLYKAAGLQQPAPVYRGSVLPVSYDAAGNMSFDPDTGLLGTIRRALSAPGDAYQGKLDPFSEEGRQRAFDLATLATPANPAMRAGEFTLPGALKNLKPPTEPPTADALRAAATKGYSDARATGATYSGGAVGSVARDTINGLNNDGVLAGLAPQTHGVLNGLANPPADSFVTIASLDAARKALGHIGNNFQNPTEQYAARRAVEGIDKIIQEGGASPSMAGPATTPRLSPPDGTGAGGPTPEARAAQLIQDARGNAAAAFRSDRITSAEDAAELRAAAANSGHNIGNATRQRLASLLNNPKQSRGYSQEELDAIEQVVKGTATSNTLRQVGNMLGGGGGLGHTMVGVIGGGLGAHLGGVEGAAAGAAIPTMLGAGARTAYNNMVGRQVNAIDELIRMRSPLYQQMPHVPQNPIIQSMMMRGLLTAPSANQNNEGLLGPIPGQ